MGPFLPALDQSVGGNVSRLFLLESNLTISIICLNVYTLWFSSFTGRVLSERNNSYVYKDVHTDIVTMAYSLLIIVRCPNQCLRAG